MSAGVALVHLPRPEDVLQELAACAADHAVKLDFAVPGQALGIVTEPKRKVELAGLAEHIAPPALGKLVTFLIVVGTDAKALANEGQQHVHLRGVELDNLH